MAGRTDLNGFQVFFAVALYFIGGVTVLLSTGYRYLPGVAIGFLLIIGSFTYERICIREKQLDDEVVGNRE
ncbi:hypothetical protein [Salarchaeum japonicum]|uniref:hypothetical protein n=1 Tax=Salarchaeum japonicum TaxID=555573 RepID=UPI001D0A09AD|nr:hypothetical protein [Salarchaeum japonicum]